MEIKNYKKDFEYSYTLGAFPTHELIDGMPECVSEVLVHRSYTDLERLEKKCNAVNVPVSCNDKLIGRLSDKENVYVIGIFNKYKQSLESEKPHIVLVNPGNMGNLGTIIRTAVGFGIYDMAIIEPGADVFNPKTVRSSMGSLFRIRHEYFKSFDEYRERYAEHEVFTFMLNGEKPLTIDNCPKPKLFSLVFGNEATGLDDSFLSKGTSIIIPQTEHVDSLNLTIAAGIGMYMFTH